MPLYTLTSSVNFTVVYWRKFNIKYSDHEGYLALRSAVIRIFSCLSLQSFISITWHCGVNAECSYIFLWCEAKNVVKRRRTIKLRNWLSSNSTQTEKFWPKCKGRTLTILTIMTTLRGSISQASKNRKYFTDFTENGMAGRWIYSSFSWYQN